MLDFAREIRAHDYPCSTLIIDDRWESCFGELAFSRDFPDPRGLLAQLAEWGFQVWLWVTPFVNQEAATFSELSRAIFWFPGGTGVAPHSSAGGAAPPDCSM